MNEKNEKAGVCILTEGVAGAGKTTAAISNANDYLAEHPEKKNKMFLLTLTNTGAKEITARTEMRIRGNTMHSFCWSLLKTQALKKSQDEIYDKYEEDLQLYVREQPRGTETFRVRQLVDDADWKVKFWIRFVRTVLEWYYSVENDKK